MRSLILLVCICLAGTSSCQTLQMDEHIQTFCDLISTEDKVWSLMACLSIGVRRSEISTLNACMKTLQGNATKYEDFYPKLCSNQRLLGMWATCFAGKCAISESGYGSSLEALNDYALNSDCVGVGQNDYIRPSARKHFASSNTMRRRKTNYRVKQVGAGRGTVLVRVAEDSRSGQPFDTLGGKTPK